MSDGQVSVWEGPGFGTATLKLPLAHRVPPRVASQRALLREALPDLHVREDFTRRFVTGFEEVLDPVLAVLESLPAHFDPRYAPEDVLELLAAWLGVRLDARTRSLWRTQVRRATELNRLRGTLAGLRLALELSFPELEFDVRDTGGVQIGPGTEPDVPPEVEVRCRQRVDDDLLKDIARVIEHLRPAHVAYHLHTPRRETR